MQPINWPPADLTVKNFIQVETPDLAFLYMCLKCGAVVMDTKRHKKWHKNIK